MYEIGLLKKHKEETYSPRLFFFLNKTTFLFATVAEIVKILIRYAICDGKKKDFHGWWVCGFFFSTQVYIYYGLVHFFLFFFT